MAVNGGLCMRKNAHLKQPSKTWLALAGGMIAAAIAITADLSAQAEDIALQEDVIESRPGPGYFSDMRASQMIVGGQDADTGEWPWQVYIISGNETRDGGLAGQSCGGVLIGEDWVITAAHCVLSDDGERFEDFYVFLGSNVVESGEMLQARRVLVHPRYDPVMIENDMALIQLERPHTSDAQVIDFADPADEALFAGNGTTAIATGWGALRDGQLLTSGGNPKQDLQSVPTYLREVELELLDYSTCRRRPYGNEISQNMLCAVAPDDDWRGVCSGDSGGPLVVEARNEQGYILVGIASWVRICGDPQYYSVFTRVSQYTGWIKKVMARF